MPKASGKHENRANQYASAKSNTTVTSSTQQPPPHTVQPLQKSAKPAIETRKELAKVANVSLVIRCTVVVIQARDSSVTVL